jgi:hypothetical protein
VQDDREKLFELKGEDSRMLANIGAFRNDVAGRQRRTAFDLRS